MIVLFLLALLVFVPAAAAFLSEAYSLTRQPGFGIGARVIYRREEISSRPRFEACDIRPSAHGEFYYYSVLNYLRVTDVLDDGRVIAVAHDNKRLCFWPNDSHFRKARLTERLIHRWRFPHP